MLDPATRLNEAGCTHVAMEATGVYCEADPARLADCTDVRLKAGRADIVAAAVHGRVTAHHRFLLHSPSSASPSPPPWIPVHGLVPDQVHIPPDAASVGGP